MILKPDVRSGKYGLVVVVNPDGSFNREFKITAEQLAQLHASANGLPPGVTRQEWESGRAVCFGKTYEVGDASMDADGVVTIKYDERISGGRIVESWLVLNPGEYTGVFPAISTIAKVGEIAIVDGALSVVEVV